MSGAGSTQIASGSELARLNALLAGNSTRANAAALYHAIHEGLTVDTATIFAILDEKPLEQINAIATEYYAYTQNDHTLEQALDGALLSLSLSQWRRARDLLRGDQAAADAEALYYAMHGGVDLGTDEATIFRILGSRTADHLDDIRSAYRTRYFIELEDDLRDDLNDAEMDQAEALMAGDPIAAAAARLRAAFEGLGTDKGEVWATLGGLTSEKRAAIADAYARKYTEQLRTRIDEEFDDSDIFGKDQTRTLTLLDHGGLTLAQRLYHALRGWGTDDVAVRAALAELRQLTVTEIGLVDQEFQGLSENRETLRAALIGDLSGRDWFNADQALAGRPEGLAGEAQQLLAFIAWETQGWDDWVANGVQWAFNDHGSVLDRAAAELQTRLQTYQATPTPETTQALADQIAYTRQHLQTFQEGRDAAADSLGTVLATAASVTVIFLVPFAAPATATLTLILYSAAAGGSWKLLGSTAVSGGTRGWEQVPLDFLEGAVIGGTAGIPFPSALAPATLGPISKGALQGLYLGSVSGFAGGALIQSLDEDNWTGGFVQGLWQAFQAGVYSGALGGITGAGVGALFGLLARVRAVNTPAADDLVRTALVEGTVPVEVATREASARVHLADKLTPEDLTTAVGLSKNQQWDDLRTLLNNRAVAGADDLERFTN